MSALHGRVPSSMSWGCRYRAEHMTTQRTHPDVNTIERAFPLVAKLARGVLTILATSMQSEHLFSLAGLVVAKKRNR